jgi:hypothetical protein
VASTDVLLVLGVSWPDRRAELRVQEVSTGTTQRLPLLGRRLGFTTVAAGPWCTGWYDLQGSGHRPCPGQRLAVGSGQCADCALRDQFRFVHHGHLGGYVPAALEPVLAAPHLLYLATFGDGFTKVGTAVEHRRTSRIDEQGPVLASYVAAAADGRVVREAEDLVTAELEVPQHRRRAAKVAALARPADRTRVATRHTETVEQVAALLGRAALGPGLAPIREQWHPPSDMGLLAVPPPQGSWVEYPSDLLTGSHGLLVEACAGPAVLARTRPEADASRYVVDLGRLKGARIVLGDVESPEAEVQEPLF